MLEVGGDEGKVVVECRGTDEQVELVDALAGMFEQIAYLAVLLERRIGWDDAEEALNLAYVVELAPLVLGLGQPEVELSHGDFGYVAVVGTYAPQGVAHAALVAEHGYASAGVEQIFCHSILPVFNGSCTFYVLTA